MKLSVVHATSDCAEVSCPTIYINEEGNYVFQGFKIDQIVKSDLKVPEQEDMVELPKAFVEAFLEKQGK